MNIVNHKLLKSALASTQMEGFPVTAETTQDCIRLLQGEISVSELIREVMLRAKSAGYATIAPTNMSQPRGSNAAGLDFFFIPL